MTVEEAVKKIQDVYCVSLIDLSKSLQVRPGDLQKAMKMNLLVLTVKQKEMFYGWLYVAEHFQGRMPPKIMTSLSNPSKALMRARQVGKTETLQRIASVPVTTPKPIVQKPKPKEEDDE